MANQKQFSHRNERAMTFSATCLLAVIGAAAASTPVSIPWAEVRVALAEPICTLVHTLPDGREGYGALAGQRKACNLPPASSALQRAVDKAYDQAQRLLVSVRPEAIKTAYEAGLDATERTRRARDAFLGSEEFLRTVVPRLRATMMEESLECKDCPTFQPKPMRKVMWSDIAVYVGAYIWTDPVHTPKDVEGKASGKPRYSFHVCSGFNGIGEIKDADPLLVRSGFLAVFGNDEFLQRVGQRFEEILSEPEFVKLDDDEARTVYLRKRLPAVVIADATARAAACRALADVSTEVGLEVTDCLPRSSERR